MRYLQPEKTIDQVAEYPSVIGFWQRKISTSGWKDHPEEGRNWICHGSSSLFLWGKAISDGKPYYCRKGRKVLICFTGRTTFRSAEPKQWCREHLASLSLDTYAERKREHIQDYQTYFNASRLTFRQEMNLDNLTTPERLKRIREGHHDIGLVNLYYDFARYLLISSSREGSLPQICRESGMKNLNPCGEANIL